MFASIALDILLILIVLLMAAIGAYRGGLREAFSAAGVVLGVLLASEWSQPWGDWLGRNTNLTEGGARFTVSVALLLLATGAVGYGVGASFNYAPGPGGRMFGGILGAGSGVVAASYTLTWARIEVFAGDEPEIMRDALLARFLDGDAGLVLLVVSGLLIAASLFGSFVRERVDPALEAAPGSPAPSGHGRTEAMPDKLEPPHERTHLSTPVQVRPSRQWEDRAGSLPPATDRQWSNTWPSDAPGVPREENPARPGQVQQARERRRSQTRPGGPNESGSG